MPDFFSERARERARGEKGVLLYLSKTFSLTTAKKEAGARKREREGSRKRKNENKRERKRTKKKEKVTEVTVGERSKRKGARKKKESKGGERDREQNTTTSSHLRLENACASKLKIYCSKMVC